MTMPMLILRPTDGAKKTAARAQNHNLNTVIDPLFSVEPVPWSPPDTPDFNALLLTSANAITFAGPGLKKYDHLPVFAVGKATAEAAQLAGFTVAATGESGAKALAAEIDTRKYDHILRLAGKHHVGVSIGCTTCIVYDSIALPLGSEAQRCLSQDNIILLHSARAAKALLSEVNRLGLVRSNSHVIAISSQVAEAATTGWKSLHVAERPTDDALLSAAAGLCSSATS